MLIFGWSCGRWLILAAFNKTQKTTTMPTDTALKELVGKHDFLSITEKGKVHCDVTDHDISGPTGPPTIAQVLAHMEQKKFKRLQPWYS